MFGFLVESMLSEFIRGQSHSVRGVGIEIGILPVLQFAKMSHPLRGAGIEIEEYA